jgi:valyl-tRNA synthetase
LRKALKDELMLLSTLARLDAEASAVTDVAPDAAISDPAAFVQIVVSDGVTVYVPLSGIVDPSKEIARLTKRATKLEKEASGLAGRLKSPKFTEKAPADVVEKSRKELAELEEQLSSVRERMATMEALLVKS